MAAECPRRLAAFLGGPEQALRLSMFRPVWFTPTLAQAESGADWYRCDVIALASEGTLAPLEGRLEGLLGRSADWKATYGLCATAEPGTEGFERVACGSPHTWRALTTVPIDARALPRCRRGPRPRHDTLHRRRPRRRRGRPRLPVGLRVAVAGAVARRPAVRRLLGPGLLTGAGGRVIAALVRRWALVMARTQAPWARYPHRAAVNPLRPAA